MRTTKTFVRGYAALFGLADLAGDIVRKGAFREGLARRKGPLDMLVEHEARLRTGSWTEVFEDQRGLFVAGALDDLAPGAVHARRLLARGGDGLSIGFVPLAARERAAGGRFLEEVDLLEVSLVSHPMQPQARLTLALGTTLRALRKEGVHVEGNQGFAAYV